MNSPYDDITVGRVTVKYVQAFKGWQLPDGSVTNNPLTAQRIAERANSQPH